MEHERFARTRSALNLLRHPLANSNAFIVERVNADARVEGYRNLQHAQKKVIDRIGAKPDKRGPLVGYLTKVWVRGAVNRQNMRERRRVRHI